MTNICELISYRQQSTLDSLQRRLFQHLHSHDSLVEKLGYSCELQGHKGCVNCLQWSDSGNLLVSGSDDMTAILWNPFQRKAEATMPTGHTGNIFSVKFLPFTGDNLLITGSEDGEVRLHDLTTFDTTQVWRCSQGRIKRVATCPNSPYLCWSASEDGCVRRLDTREPHTCDGDGTCRNVLIDIKLSTKSGLAMSPQCKCIDINPVRTELIAIGALDTYARIYDARLCTLRSPGRSSSSESDPSCVTMFSPGHITSSIVANRGRKPSCSTVASTYITFSPDGRELLVNLSGEQIYLYDIMEHQVPLSYEFDKSNSSFIPRLRPILQTYRKHLSGVAGIRTKLMPFVSEPHSIPKRSVEETEVSSKVLKLRDKGKEFYKQEKFNEALRSLNSAVDLCPNWHILYFLRGTTLYSRKWTGDIYAALRDIETSLSLSPSHKLSQQRRIQCLMDLDMHEEANRFLHQYQLDHPSDSKFTNRTKKELEKSKSIKDGRVQASNGSSSYHGNGRTNHHLLSHQQPVFDYKKRYCGHCNTHTDIKEAVFIGDRGNYIAAGSDDGNIFIWEKSTGNLVRVLNGDTSIVNCIQWHPTTALMATSGIENVVRLWEPNCGGKESESRVKLDLIKISKDNQHRMGVDPFEVMLMRMGFRLAMAEEGEIHYEPHEGDDEGAGGGANAGGGGGSGGDDAAESGNELRWIQNPSNCRQS